MSAKGSFSLGPSFLSINGTVTPTLPAILGGMWSSRSPRISQHTLVLCAFLTLHRCTGKGTVSNGYKEPMGSLERRVEDKGALIVSPKCSGTIFRTCGELVVLAALYGL